MSRITRRGALGGAVAAMLVGLATTPQALRAASPVTIPRKPMRLLRRLERGMRGGAVLSVQREWRIAFAPQGSGFAITGEQVSALVDAPEHLAPLAKIEQSRSTAAMFPILLGSNGFISAEGIYTQPYDHAAALQEAEKMIKARRISGAAKLQQLRHLSQMQSAGTAFLNRLPPDLFFPAQKPFRAVQPVNLPDGVTGEFEVSYSAESFPNHAWLREAERRVVTRIGRSERRSREVWTMAQL